MSEYVQLGGFTKFRQVQSTTKAYLELLKPEIFKMYTSQSTSTAESIVMFEPVQESSQIVNGVRYKVKVQITSNSFLHIVFVKKYDGTLNLEQVLTGKSSVDGL